MHLSARLPGAWRRLRAAGGSRALDAALCVAGPLAVGQVTGNLDVAPAVSLGGFTVLYARKTPYRQRALVLPHVGAVFVLAVAVGATAGESPVRVAVGIAGVAALATWQAEALRLGPPGGYLPVLACGVATVLSGPSAELSLLAAGGVAVAWLVSMHRWIWAPSAPEQRAMEAAAASLARLQATTRAAPGPAADAVSRHIHATAADLRVAQRAVDGASRRGDPPAAARRCRALRLGFLELVQGRQLDSVESVPWADRPAHPVRRPGILTGLGRRVGGLPVALRAGAAALTAGLLAPALGLASAYWAPLAAVAVLQGTDLRTTRRRAGQRAAGTAVGALLAGALLAVEPPAWLVIALVALLQAGAELVIARNYLVAVVLVTPLALLLAHLGAAQTQPSQLVVARLADTALGCAVALVAGHLLLPRVSTRRLPALTKGAVAAIVRVSARNTDGSDASEAALHDLDARLGELGDVVVSAQGEFLGTGQRDLLVAKALATIDVGHLAIAVATSADDDARRRLSSVVGTLTNR